MAGLVRCHGRDDLGCPDDALVRPGRRCSACDKSTPEPKVKKRRSRGIEALIDAATTEAVQAERQARRMGARR
jgi:hypothetical protein